MAPQGVFERVRHLLLPRLVRAGTQADDALQRELGAGLTAILCVPATNGYHFLQTGTPRVWDVDSAELWSVALHNLRREPVTSHMLVPGPNPVYGLNSPSEYTAAHLLRLDDVIGGPTPYGVLVLIPCDTWLCYWVIRGPEVVLAGQSLAEWAKNLWGEVHNSAGRLSPYLLWWHEGVLEPVEYVVSQTPDNPNTPTSIQTSTVRFRDMLHRLASPQP